MIDDEPVHVMPTYGQPHKCAADCWCDPVIENAAEIESGEHAALVYVHKAMH